MLLSLHLMRESMRICCIVQHRVSHRNFLSISGSTCIGCVTYHLCCALLPPAHASSLFLFPRLQSPADSLTVSSLDDPAPLPPGVISSPTGSALARARPAAARDGHASSVSSSTATALASPRSNLQQQLHLAPATPSTPAHPHRAGSASGGAAAEDPLSASPASTLAAADVDQPQVCDSWQQAPSAAAAAAGRAEVQPVGGAGRRSRPGSAASRPGSASSVSRSASSNRAPGGRCVGWVGGTWEAFYGGGYSCLDNPNAPKSMRAHWAGLITGHPVLLTFTIRCWYCWSSCQRHCPSHLSCAMSHVSNAVVPLPFCCQGAGGAAAFQAIRLEPGYGVVHCGQAVPGSTQ